MSSGTLIDIYIILDGFEGDTKIYCTSYDNIAGVEDECNIVIASAIYSKQHYFSLPDSRFSNSILLCFFFYFNAIEKLE